MISIVMPSKDREAYLAETIDSILAQSYKDFELIIVDDGSTDGSRHLYDYYTKKDERVKVIYIKYSGISIARMTGVKESKGEYIAVMDSDDVMVVDRLKLSLKKIKGHDFVYSPYGIFKDGEVTVFDPPHKVTFEDVKKNGAWPHVTIMARRECFDGAYREDFKVNDDAWLVWQFFKRGYKAKYINRPLVAVRFHEGNTSKRKKEIAVTQKIMDAEYDTFSSR